MIADPRGSCRVMTSAEREQRETGVAAAGTAAIGGEVSAEKHDARGEAHRPLAEAGESEGFEETERELIDHAAHRDQHAARRVIEDAPDRADDARTTSREAPGCGSGPRCRQPRRFPSGPP